MMTRRLLLVLALALCSLTISTHGFIPTKKKSAERRAAFSKQKSDGGDHEDDSQAVDAAQTTQYQPGPSPTALYATPPAAVAHAAALYEYEEEDEEEVSYEVALISCIVSLAIGFGTGYLV
mmetsp:Transcript_31647/g.74472  ORF Transcript_31647/g.74472 Transcript_31647/m.74472 type:complete len:121 (-) Transcript_31647:340-702(-)